MKQNGEWSSGITNGTGQELVSLYLLPKALKHRMKTHLMLFIGYKQQARYKEVMMKKNRTLQQKYQTYKTHVEQYHYRHPDSPIIQLPTLEEVKDLTVDDPFWNVGSLTHPNERWAVDIDTQNGIQAYRTLKSCEEELRRIAQEVRKMVRWSLAMEEKLEELLNLSKMGVWIYSFKPIIQSHTLTSSTWFSLGQWMSKWNSASQLGSSKWPHLTRELEDKSRGSSSSS